MMILEYFIVPEKHTYTHTHTHTDTHTHNEGYVKRTQKLTGRAHKSQSWSNLSSNINHIVLACNVSLM